MLPVLLEPVVFLDSELARTNSPVCPCTHLTATIQMPKLLLFSSTSTDCPVLIQEQYTFLSKNFPTYSLSLGQLPETWFCFDNV